MALGARPIIVMDVKLVERFVQAILTKNSEQRAAALQAVIAEGEAVVPELIRALDTDEEDVHVGLAEACQQIGVSSLNPLVDALSDDKPQRRAGAVMALGMLGDEQVIAPLVTRLRDGDWWVRRYTLNALTHLGEPAIKVLIDGMRDTNVSTRVLATQALVEIGSPAINALLTALDSTHEQVRMYAALALGDIGDPSVRADLKMRQHDPAVRVQKAIRRALFKLTVQR